VPTTVNMITPEGRTVAVPAEEVEYRAGQGFRAETGIDYGARQAAGVAESARERDAGGIIGGINAGIAGLARGASFGLSDLVLRDLGVSSDTLRGLKEEHGTVSAIGEIAGSIAPAILSGGTSTAATAARLMPAGATARLGARIAGAGGFTRTVASGATEGALQSAGMYLSDSALADKDLSAEGFAVAAGVGGLLGGGASAAFHGAEKAFVAAKKLIPKHKLTREALRRAKDDVDVQLQAALAAGDKSTTAAVDALEMMRLQNAELDMAAQAKLREIKIAEAQARTALVEQRLAAQAELNAARLAKARASRVRGKGRAPDEVVPAAVGEPEIPTSAVETAAPATDAMPEREAWSPEVVSPPAAGITEGESDLEDLLKRSIEAGQKKAAPSGPPRISGPSVTPEEALLIRGYQRNTFTELNDYSRTGSIDPDGEFGTKELLDAKAAEFDDMIAKRTVEEPLTLYRGAPITGSLEPGSVWADKGYMSTAPNQEEAVRFVSRGTPSALLKIDMPAGSNAMPLTTHSGDVREVVLPRGMQLRVDAVEGAVSSRAGEIPVVKMSVVPTDAPAVDSAAANQLATAAPEIPEGFGHVTPRYRRGKALPERVETTLPTYEEAASNLKDESSNVVYAIRPSELATADIWGAELKQDRVDSILRGWSEGATLWPVEAFVTPSGRLLIEDGNHRITAAALTDRPVLLTIRTAPDSGFMRPNDRSIAQRIRDALPPPNVDGGLQQVRASVIQPIHEAMAAVDPAAKKIVDAIKANEAATDKILRQFTIKDKDGTHRVSIPEMAGMTVGRVKQAFAVADDAERAAILETIGPTKSKALTDIVKSESDFADWHGRASSEEKAAILDVVGHAQKRTRTARDVQWRLTDWYKGANETERAALLSAMSPGRAEEFAKLANDSRRFHAWFKNRDHWWEDPAYIESLNKPGASAEDLVPESVESMVSRIDRSEIGDEQVDDFMTHVRKHFDPNLKFDDVVYGFAPPPGFKTKITKIDPRGGIEMRIIDESGGEIGTLHRTFSDDGTVKNRMIDIDESRRGAGVDGYIHNNSLGMYRRIGAKDVDRIGDDMAHEAGVPGDELARMTDEHLAELEDMHRAISDLSDYERTVSELVTLLGPQASPDAANLAAGYAAAVDAQARKVTTRLAQALDDMPVPSASAPESALSSTSFAGDVEPRDAARRAAGTISLSGAGQIASQSSKKGLFGALADIGAANEALQMVGGSLPFLPDADKIPVIGPLVGGYLKLRAIAKGLGKVGIKIPLLGETRVAAGAAQTQDRIADALDGILSMGARAVSKGRPVASAQAWRAPDVLSAVLYDDGEKRKPSRDIADIMRARTGELVAAQSNPEGVRTTVRAAMRDVRDPDVIDAVTSVAQRKLAYLAKHAPYAPPPSLLGRTRWAPSPSDVEKFARRVRASNDPVSVLEDVRTGRVTPEAVEALREVYPRLYDEARTRLIERAPEVNVKLPAAVIVRLSVLFDAPLMPSMEPENLRAIQGAGAPRAQEAQPGMPPAGALAPPPAGAPKIDQLYMTAAQKRA